MLSNDCHGIAGNYSAVWRGRWRRRALRWPTFWRNAHRRCTPVEVNRRFTEQPHPLFAFCQCHVSQPFLLSVVRPQPNTAHHHRLQWFTDSHCALAPQPVVALSARHNLHHKRPILLALPLNRRTTIRPLRHQRRRQVRITSDCRRYRVGGRLCIPGRLNRPIGYSRWPAPERSFRYAGHWPGWRKHVAGWRRPGEFRKRRARSPAPPIAFATAPSRA